MTPYNDKLKDIISFVDKEGRRADVRVEITDRNGYLEFTASADYCGSGGQCLDSIVPKTAKQTELINLWGKYHLKNISKIHNFTEHLKGILSVIYFDQKMYEKEQEEKQKDMTKDEILKIKMHEYDIIEDQSEACEAYLKLPYRQNLKDFQELYSGEYESDEAFAEGLASECGDLDKEPRWPYTCIDWTEAAEQLMMDYVEQDGYYFRK